MRHKSVALIFVAAVTAAACDDGDPKFENVQPVEAPPASEDTKGVAAQAHPAMPADHPVVNTESPTPKPQMVQFSSPSEYGKTGPLRWTAPDTWQPSQPGTKMRLAEYLIPPNTTVSIFYFGPGGGGGVDANIDRWVGQFDDGKAKPTRAQKNVNGLTVHTVDVAGTYNAGMAGGGAPAAENQRMLGAIVESSAGLFFFKLVGPKDSVQTELAGWNSFVDSLAPGS